MFKFAVHLLGQQKAALIDAATILQNATIDSKMITSIGSLFADPIDVEKT